MGDFINDYLVCPDPRDPRLTQRMGGADHATLQSRRAPGAAAGRRFTTIDDLSVGNLAAS
jgi:hypothetical protein